MIPCVYNSVRCPYPHVNLDILYNSPKLRKEKKQQVTGFLLLSNIPDYFKGSVIEKNEKMQSY